MKRISQLKKLASFAKDHGVIQMELTPEGDIVKMFFVHKEEQPNVDFSASKNYSNNNHIPSPKEEEDDLFYSVNLKPLPIKTKATKNENK